MTVWHVVALAIVAGIAVAMSWALWADSRAERRREATRAEMRRQLQELRAERFLQGSATDTVARRRRHDHERRWR